VVAQALLDLVDWRRRVGDLYRIRGATPAPEARGPQRKTLELFRRGRDDLFKTHPQSPIEPEEREAFRGLSYFAADDSSRVRAQVEDGDGTELVINTGGEDGAVTYRRSARLVFELGGTECHLTVLSLVQYAGGLFVPFRDATSGHETYGGGRYLFDTVKNHLPMPVPEAGESMVEIDFNYAYNPSCAYSPRWACPLAPPENYLKVPVRAGERVYKAPVVTDHDGGALPSS